MLSSILLLLHLIYLGDAAVHIPIVRRGSLKLKTEDDFKAMRDNLIAKYTQHNFTSSKRKRQNSASVSLTDIGLDTTYFAPIKIGSSGQTFNVIMDTGSSDLFVASNECLGCGNAASYTPSSSSGSPVNLQYGSGSATGIVVSDSVSLGDFTISNQQFVAANSVSDGLLQSSLSGLLGLAFQSIAVSGATPFVQALSQSKQLSSQEMSFFLQRQIDSNDPATELPGGTFTIGGTDSSLFQGDIDFVDLVGSTPTFWLIPITSIGVQGTTFTASNSLAAIDTGTTLIGGPTSDVQAIYSNIAGASELSGTMSGFWTVPCNSKVFVSFTFGSKSWTIAPVDFLAQQLTRNRCLGGIFASDIGAQGGPDWVVGDVFLKNVYSVFRFSPGPSVGFATLASNLQGTSPSSSQSNSGSAAPDPSSHPSSASSFSRSTSSSDPSETAGAPATTRTASLPTAGGGTGDGGGVSGPLPTIVVGSATLSSRLTLSVMLIPLSLLAYSLLG